MKKIKAQQITESYFLRELNLLLQNSCRFHHNYYLDKKERCYCQECFVCGIDKKCKEKIKKDGCLMYKKISGYKEAQNENN